MPEPASDVLLTTNDFATIPTTKDIKNRGVRRKAGKLQNHGHLALLFKMLRGIPEMRKLSRLGGRGSAAEKKSHQQHGARGQGRTQHQSPRIFVFPDSGLHKARRKMHKPAPDGGDVGRAAVQVAPSCGNISECASYARKSFISDYHHERGLGRYVVLFRFPDHSGVNRHSHHRVEALLIQACYLFHGLDSARNDGPARGRCL